MKRKRFFNFCTAAAVMLLFVGGLTLDATPFQQTEKDKVGKLKRDIRPLPVVKKTKPGDLSIRFMKCPPKVVKAGQNLKGSFHAVGKSTYFRPIKDVVVDFIMTRRPGYPSPAPLAVVSAHYSDNVLLSGGRENIDFRGPGDVTVKINGNVKIPVDTPPGVYYIGAVIDAGNKYNETNEKNNVHFCRVVVKTGDAPAEVAKKPVITGYAQRCAIKGYKLTINGRDFGDRAGKGVAMGGHGVHVDLEIIHWMDTRVVVMIPHDRRLHEGEWYYVGIEKEDHRGWLSNISKTITICPGKSKR